MDVPFDKIDVLRMVIGERCRVESENDGTTRTLTVTTEKGVICVFKGEMEFTFITAQPVSF